jgi:uncharacterized membrane protein YeaQ/YmgE (transglycosylase-associated protein family)
MFLILAIIAIGAAAGWAAHLILGGSTRSVNWAEAFGAGIVGSFLGGLLGSLIAGDGFDLRMSGLLGSVVGAVIVLAIWRTVRSR